MNGTSGQYIQSHAWDWGEDFSYENGMYQNKCIRCSCMFLGHKRRVICKLCAGFVHPRRECGLGLVLVWSSVFLAGLMVLAYVALRELLK